MKEKIVQKIKQFFKNWTAGQVKKARAETPKSLKQLRDDQAYFTRARSWSDDIYTSAVVSRNRYKAAFFGMTAFSAILVLSVLILVSTEHTELVVVHEGPSGYTWISTTKDHEKAPIDWTRTQSEIAHYVRTRESYDPLLYEYQTNEVKLLSTPQVEAEYDLAQSSDNKASPINVLGAKGYRTIVVNNVLQLDSIDKNHDGQGRHVNFAQVNYVVEDHLFGQNQVIKTPYTALVSWEYNGVPDNPEKKLRDWDGFSVTKYVVQPVNLGSNNTDE
jgi:type IV secretion system protein VirB8